MHFASNIIYAKYMVIASLIHISVGRIQNCVDSKFELNNLNHLKKNLNNAADDKKKVWSAIPPLPYYFKDRSPRKIQNLGLCSLQFRTTGNWHIFTTVLISSFFPGTLMPYPMYVYVCLFFSVDPLVVQEPMYTVCFPPSARKWNCHKFQLITSFYSCYTAVLSGSLNSLQNIISK